ncbi:hypothetical protein [Mycolicibacterium helvum]|uniref:Uncharacterized protein n=1 Tax=Mycolicibacterium helvum TaxID=1534349 RepID=A0A7I7TBG1_9MYCO|nr:hypothetical protein MHEL_39280 [Mycolicibacterium helvum]
MTIGPCPGTGAGDGTDVGVGVGSPGAWNGGGATDVVVVGEVGDVGDVGDVSDVVGSVVSVVVVVVGVVVVVVVVVTGCRTSVRGTHVYDGSGMKPGGTTWLAGSGAGGAGW